MPIETFYVKVEVGARTPVSVWVEHNQNKTEEVKFINGKTLKKESIANWLAEELQKQLKAIENA